MKMRKCKSKGTNNIYNYITFDDIHTGNYSNIHLRAQYGVEVDYSTSIGQYIIQNKNDEDYEVMREGETLVFLGEILVDIVKYTSDENFLIQFVIVTEEAEKEVELTSNEPTSNVVMKKCEENENPDNTYEYLTYDDVINENYDKYYLFEKHNIIIFKKDCNDEFKIENIEKDSHDFLNSDYNYLIFDDYDIVNTINQDCFNSGYSNIDIIIKKENETDTPKYTTICSECLKLISTTIETIQYGRSILCKECCDKLKEQPITESDRQAFILNESTQITVPAKLEDTSFEINSLVADADEITMTCNVVNSETDKDPNIIETYLKRMDCGAINNKNIHYVYTADKSEQVDFDNLKIKYYIEFDNNSSYEGDIELQDDTRGKIKKIILSAIKNNNKTKIEVFKDGYDDEKKECIFTILNNIPITILINDILYLNAISIYENILYLSFNSSMENTNVNVDNEEAINALIKLVDIFNFNMFTAWNRDNYKNMTTYNKRKFELPCITKAVIKK